jgi:hypothetical protein
MAYLDPGTGSIILQAMAGALLFIGAGWRFIKSKLIEKIVTPLKNIFKKK